MPNQENGFDARQLQAADLSRRRILRFAALGGAAAAAAPLIAACGNAGSGAGAGGKVNPTAGGGGAVSTEMLQQLKGLLGPFDEKTMGKGLTISMGAVLALSGPGSFYGAVMSKGINLAVKQIKAMGGPTFNIQYKDHKSGDPQAGIAAIRELGSAGTPACLSSYAADLFAMLPGINQYKVMTLDGGGGTSDAGESKPYFWGMRAITPDDTFGGVIKYIKAKMSDVRRIASVGWDLGPASQLVINKLRAQLQAAGLQLVDSELTTVGATDYSTALSRVRASNPDLILLSIYGLDPGYFMKQYVTSGIGKPVIGSEFTPDAARASDGAYNQYLFAYDYFNSAQPTNDWAKIFVDSFRQQYGTVQYEPDFYAANYYEDTFAMWDLIRRVLKQGGNVHSGTDLQHALEANPEFKSVYGGSGSTLGTLALDRQSHSVSRRPMGIFAFKDGTITSRAFFNLGGADFHLV